MSLRSFDGAMKSYKHFIGWKAYHHEPGRPRKHTHPFRILVINDLHIPYHDEAAFRHVVETNRGQVDLCVVAGDFMDMFSFSRYPKRRQHFTPKEELVSGQSAMAYLSEAFPQLIILAGNHDERFRKDLISRGLEGDKLEFLLELDKDYFNPLAKMAMLYDNVSLAPSIKDGYAEYTFLWQRGDLVIGHPELFSKIPNKSASSFIHWLESVALTQKLIKPFRVAAMGHTHQAGKTWNDYGKVGMELGCLSAAPDYAADPKLRGAGRPPVLGYSIFVQDQQGRTDVNASNFYQVGE